MVVDNFYGKLYLDNQFSLKADASNSVTTNYLTTNYTNTVDLTSVYYNKTETDNLLANINPNLSNYYTKTEIDDLDNELSTLILDTYTKTEVDTQLTDYMTLVGNIFLQ